MKTITFYFDIKPERKERPRFSRFGGVYTTKKNKDFETTVAALGRSQMNKLGVTPITGLIHADVQFRFEKPKKTICQTPRMDLDNLLKSLFDGLNGIAYEDDTQIAGITAVKEWTTRNEIILILTEFEEKLERKSRTSKKTWYGS